MPCLIINQSNITNDPWVWNFLEEERLKGIFFHKANKKYTHKGRVFVFEYPILARERKSRTSQRSDEKNFAYEMISDSKVGSGAYASVKRILFTLSLGHSGQSLQAIDKDRVVKDQFETLAYSEYKKLQHASHLKAKPPVKNFIVMKRVPGISLKKFIDQHVFIDNHDRLEFTRTLFKSIRNQLIDKKISHNDLHYDNILVSLSANTPRSYLFNVIDFNLAKYKPNATEEELVVYYKLFKFGCFNILKRVWKTKDAPKNILKKINDYDYLSIEKYFNSLNLPHTTHHQKVVEQILSFLEKLNQDDSNLGLEFEKELQHVLTLKDNVFELNELIKNWRDRLNSKAHYSQIYFPFIVFDNDEHRQNLFLQLGVIYKSLYEKSVHLQKTSGFQLEGQQLQSLVFILQQISYNAIYNKSGVDSQLLEQCKTLCIDHMRKNYSLLALHQNSNYLWAEIGVALCSLLLFYPLLMGINYLCTKRIGFFTETKSEKQIAEVNTIFESIETSLDGTIQLVGNYIVP